MSGHRFFLSAFLTFAVTAPPSVAGVFIHCAEFNEGQGKLQGLAWFEVFGGGPTPSDASRGKGYYSLDELNDRTVGCRLDGHEYAFGVTEYHEVPSPMGAMDVYRARLVIDGVQVWISEEIPPNPMEKAVVGEYVPFFGTVRVDSGMVAICKLGGITDIGDFAAPEPDSEPLKKPQMDPLEYVGYRYGCERHYLRVPAP